MSISEENIEILIQNQWKHFQQLKDAGTLDVDFSYEDTRTLIRAAFSETIQANSFTHSVAKDNEAASPIRYVTSLITSSDPDRDRLATIEFILTSYLPELHRILGSSIKITRTVLSDMSKILQSELKSSAITAIGYALRSKLDIIAVQLACEAAKSSPSLNFDTTPENDTSRASDLSRLPPPEFSFVARAQQIFQVINECEAMQFTKYFRGGVSQIIAGAKAAQYLALNRLFKDVGAQSPVGVYRVGEISNIPVYCGPGAALPEDQILLIWKNPNNELDVSISFTNCIPLYYNTETQAFDVLGDYRVLNSHYIVQVNLVHLNEGL